MSEAVNKSLRMEGRDRSEHLLTLKGFVALFLSLFLLHDVNSLQIKACHKNDSTTCRVLK